MNKSFAVKFFSIILIGLLIIPGSTIAAPTSRSNQNHPPAILLFIGDGMAEAHRTAGRWRSVGQNGQLHMDMLPVSGWSKTNAASGAVTDSAAAATAMATGVKTLNGRISIGPSGKWLPTILEQAQEKGWAVGLVSTTQITHATPAAFAAHEMSRLNYTSIASQIFEHNVDVLLAGGEDDWLPETESGCHPNMGHRTDGRNLISEAIDQDYTYVCDIAGFTAIDLDNTDKLLGLFADDGMLRSFSPTLGQMTAAAIAILSRDPDGFFLMVEGGQIDWAAHANDAQNVIHDVIDFDAAISLGRAYAQENSNTLMVVTADHETGGMNLNLTASGAPDEDGPFHMPDGTPFYVNWATTSHTSVDIPTTAQGKLSEHLAGTYENTHIYKVMRQVLGWEINMPIVAKQGDLSLKALHKGGILRSTE